MSEKSEALRLANDLEIDYHGDVVAHEAAAELRRLHDEVESLRQAYNIVTDDCRNLTEKVIPNIRAQRDALLEALKRMASIIDKMGDMPDGFIHPSPWQELKCEEALTQARAAIAAVEEGK